MQTTTKIERVIYPIDEARTLLGGIARQTVYDLISAGKLTSIKIGRRRLIPAESIEACSRLLQSEQAATIRSE